MNTKKAKWGNQINRKVLAAVAMAFGLLVSTAHADVVIHASSNQLRNTLIVGLVHNGWTLNAEDYRSLTFTGWGHSPKGVPTFIRIHYVIVGSGDTTYTQSYVATWRPDGFQHTRAYQPYLQELANRAQFFVLQAEGILNPNPMRQQPAETWSAPVQRL
jgi:hypothetical protein